MLYMSGQIHLMSSSIHDEQQYTSSQHDPVTLSLQSLEGFIQAFQGKSLSECC